MDSSRRLHLRDLSDILLRMVVKRARAIHSSSEAREAQILEDLPKTWLVIHHPKHVSNDI